MQEYPKYKYHREKDTVVVESSQEEKKLGKDWVDSPAEFGIETCPGESSEEKILANLKKTKPIKNDESGSNK